MSLHTVEEIERAIGALTQQEQEELREWLEAQPQPMDASIAADLATGRLDNAIQQALADEKQGNVRPLECLSGTGQPANSGGNTKPFPKLFAIAPQSS